MEGEKKWEMKKNEGAIILRGRHKKVLKITRGLGPK